MRARFHGAAAGKMAMLHGEALAADAAHCMQRGSRLHNRAEKLCVLWENRGDIPICGKFNLAFL
jgi:hypothetical protein